MTHLTDIRATLRAVYDDVRDALAKLDGYAAVTTFETTGEWPWPTRSALDCTRVFWCDFVAHYDARTSGAALIEAAWVALPHLVEEAEDRATFARWLTENEAHLAAEHVRGELIRLLEHFTRGGEHPATALTWAEFRDECIFPCWEDDGSGVDDAREFMREAREDVAEHPEAYSQWPRIVSEVTGHP